jgi:hypothetical protein
MDKIDRAFAEKQPIHDALKRGIRQAMAVHKRLGHSVVVWRDGKVVWIPAEEISVGIEESENPKPYPATANLGRQSDHRRL